MGDEKSLGSTYTALFSGTCMHATILAIRRIDVRTYCNGRTDAEISAGGNNINPALFILLAMPFF